MYDTYFAELVTTVNRVSGLPTLDHDMSDEVGHLIRAG